MIKKTKKKNPVDLTLRNLRSLKKKLADLSARVKFLESTMFGHSREKK